MLVINFEDSVRVRMFVSLSYIQFNKNDQSQLHNYSWKNALVKLNTTITLNYIYIQLDKDYSNNMAAFPESLSMRSCGDVEKELLERKELVENARKNTQAGYSLMVGACQRIQTLNQKKDKLQRKMEKAYRIIDDVEEEILDIENQISTQETDLRGSSGKINVGFLTQK